MFESEGLLHSKSLSLDKVPRCLMWGKLRLTVSVPQASHLILDLSEPVFLSGR